MNFMKAVYWMPRCMKCWWKKMEFHRNSICGKNVSIGAGARCISSNKNSIVIGERCDLHCILAVQDCGTIIIGSHTTIRGDTVLGSVRRIEIGDHVIISNNVHIYDNNNHPTAPEARYQMCENGFYGLPWQWNQSESKPIKIGSNVWIGERATILKGVVIGSGSIVACDTVVTGEVPENVIVAGNPGRIVKHLKGDAI